MGRESDGQKEITVGRAAFEFTVDDLSVEEYGKLILEKDPLSKAYREYLKKLREMPAE